MSTKYPTSCAASLLSEDATQDSGCIIYLLSRFHSLDLFTIATGLLIRTTMRHLSWYHTYFCLTLVSALTLFSVGCGQSGPAVEYVKGVVTLDGTPLEGATVFFSPKGSGGIGAAGMTQPDGSFTLNAKGAKPSAGTAAGDYSVTVTKVEMPEFPNITEDDPRYGTPEHDRLNQEAGRAKPKAIVPEKYNSAETSPFTAKVESGSNTFTFDISSKDD